MKFSKKMLLGIGTILISGLCLSGPHKVDAGVTPSQKDGVMGQSIKDETVYKPEETGAGIFSLMRAAASYDDYIADAWTSEGEYTNATYYHRAEFENCILFNGIDVSWWQGGGRGSTNSYIQWEKAHEDGIDFAFVRVASRDTKDGSIYEDTTANAHIKGAKANDINVGLYIFSQALNEKEAKEEANYVLKLIKKYKWDVTMPIVMDREAGTNKRLTAGKLSKSAETKICNAFADTISGAGYRPMVYASASWILNYMDLNSLKQHGCRIWLSRFNNKTDQKVNTSLTYEKLATINYEFWQYNSKARVDGYSGNIDVNFWYKDTSVKTTGLKVTGKTTSSLSLKWNKASDDAAGYHIYRYNTEKKKYEYLAATTKTSYVDNKVSAGKTYKYKVRCYWKIGGEKYYGLYSAEASGETLTDETTPPKQVKGVTSDTVGESFITISWDEVDGANGYRIYKYNEDTGSYEVISDVTGANTYTVEGLESAREYCFKVKAYKDIDSKKLWGTASAGYKEVTKPVKVQNLTSPASSASEISIKWEPVTGATGYYVYRLNGKTNKYEKAAAIKGEQNVQYKDKKRSAGTEYSYKVCAYKTNEDGETYAGGSSNAIKVITNPAQVKNLKLSTKSSSVTLKWDKVAGATGYIVYRRNGKTGKYDRIATVKGAAKTSYVNTRLNNGATYHYRVRAYKTSNGKTYYGLYSSIKKIKVK